MTEQMRRGGKKKALRFESRRALESSLLWERKGDGVVFCHRKDNKRPVLLANTSYAEGGKKRAHSIINGGRGRTQKLRILPVRWDSKERNGGGGTQIYLKAATAIDGEEEQFPI